MRLELDPLDLKPEFIKKGDQAISTGEVTFAHLSEAAQKAVLAVGRATFHSFDRQTYNAVYPPVNVNATAVRIIQKKPLVIIMDDATFRVYHTAHSPKDPERDHFAVGMAAGKSDDEILAEASEFLCGSCVQFYHEDGTPHI